MFTSNKVRIAEIIKYYKNNRLSFNNPPIVTRLRPQILISMTIKPVPHVRMDLRQRRPTINNGIIYKSVQDLSVFLKLSSSGTVRRLMSDRYPDCNYLDIFQPEYINTYCPKPEE